MRKLLTSAIACVLLQGSVPAAAQELPDGPGKQIVATACGTCHDVNRIRIGYTAEGWRTVIRMMQNVEAPVAPDQWATVTDYLIRSFPERPRPTAVIAPGSVAVLIREWAVPTPGSRPHDPLATRDGAIWWTGQLANKLGRLDPKTGEIKEYPLKSPRTGPHGLVEDDAGNIWFTGNTAGLIGKLDPRTGAVTEYNLPNRDARDPHTLIFDKEGILWFTVEQANMVGRLDPRTGVIRLTTSPTPKSRPYGMALNSKNVVFFVEFGTHKIASIDAETMAITEYTLPNAGARPRRIAIGADDLSGTWISHAGFSDDWTRAPAASKNGHRPAGPSRSPMASCSRRERCGTACRRPSRTRSFALTRKPKGFRAGSSRGAATSCETWT